MKKLIVATTNKGKLAEIQAVLREFPCELVSLEDFAVPAPEENGASFRENALIKARYYADKLGLPCLADDSGLEVDALSGAPGVRSARFAGDNASDSENNALLLQKLSVVPAGHRQARFCCVLALVVGTAAITADGYCKGIILTEPAGQGGFGYDPLFFVPELGCTMAEARPAEKNRISHRGRALVSMQVKIREMFGNEDWHHK